MPQCKAKTGKGARCKKSAVEGSDYCGIASHQAQGGGARSSHAPPSSPKKSDRQISLRCRATKRDGTQCTKPAREGSDFCGIAAHQAQGEGALVRMTAKTDAKVIDVVSVQCRGTIKDTGRRCLSNTRHASGYCQKHRGQFAEIEVELEKTMVVEIASEEDGVKPLDISMESVEAPPAAAGGGGSSEKTVTARQCRGTTSKGTRCRRMTTRESGFCCVTHEFGTRVATIGKDGKQDKVEKLWEFRLCHEVEDVEQRRLKQLISGAKRYHVDLMRTERGHKGVMAWALGWISAWIVDAGLKGARRKQILDEVENCAKRNLGYDVQKVLKVLLDLYDISYEKLYRDTCAASVIRMDGIDDGSNYSSDACGPAVQALLILHDNCRCVYDFRREDESKSCMQFCEPSSVPEFQIEHVIPQKGGGEHSLMALWNFRLACARCNNFRDKWTGEDFVGLVSKGVKDVNIPKLVPHQDTKKGRVAFEDWVKHIKLLKEAAHAKRETTM